MITEKQASKKFNRRVDYDFGREGILPWSINKTIRVQEDDKFLIALGGQPGEDILLRDVVVRVFGAREVYKPKR